MTALAASVVGITLGAVAARGGRASPAPAARSPEGC